MKPSFRIKCYMPFSANAMKRNMAYRGAFFIRLLSQFLTVCVTYYLWKAIYASSAQTAIRGFHFSEMISYILMNFLTAIMTGIGGPIANMIADDVSNGSIAMQLIKPISYRGIKLAEHMGNLVVNVLLVIPFGLVFLVAGGIRFASAEDLLLYVLSVFLGFLCMFYFGFCFGLFSFYTTYFFGMNMAMTVLIQFCSGSLIPLSFFPESIGRIFYLLPFASMNYTPIMIYLGKMQGKDIVCALGLQAFWVLFFYLLGTILWNRAVRRLTILGG